MPLKFLSNSFGDVKLLVWWRYLLLAYTVIYYYTIFNIIVAIYSTGLHNIYYYTIFNIIDVIYSTGLHSKSKCGYIRNLGSAKWVWKNSSAILRHSQDTIKRKLMGHRNRWLWKVLHWPMWLIKGFMYYCFQVMPF